MSLWADTDTWGFRKLRFGTQGATGALRPCGSNPCTVPKQVTPPLLGALINVAESWGFAALPAATLDGYAPFGAPPATCQPWRKPRGDARLRERPPDVRANGVRIPAPSTQKKSAPSLGRRIILAESWGFEPQIGLSPILA